MNGVAKLKEKLQNMERIYSTMVCEWNSTRLPSAYKSGGLDFIITDLEHGTFYPEALREFGQACRNADIPLVARVQDCEYHCISKCIDMGADGVMIPRTETFEQVETAIRSLRMYPYGKKGVGGACMRPGETIAEFNQNRLLFLQIESPQGVELLDEILTKYGDQVAGIIIGPNDLEASMGYPTFNCEKPDETYNDCIRKVIKVSNAHGKSCGIFMMGDEDAKKWHKEGMNIFWVNVELGMIISEAKRVRKFIDELE